MNPLGHWHWKPVRVNTQIAVLSHTRSDPGHAVPDTIVVDLLGIIEIDVVSSIVDGVAC